MPRAVESPRRVSSDHRLGYGEVHSSLWFRSRAFATMIDPLLVSEAGPRPRGRGKYHASGRRNGLGGAATTPGSYRRGELQSAGSNQIRPACESARSKFSYSFRSFSGFQKRELDSVPCVHSSPNATESFHGSPKVLPPTFATATPAHRARFLFVSLNATRIQTRVTQLARQLPSRGRKC